MTEIKRGRPPKMDKLLEKITHGDIAKSSEIISDLPIDELSNLIKNEYQSQQLDMQEFSLDSGIDPNLLDEQLQLLENSYHPDNQQLKMLGEVHSGFPEPQAYMPPIPAGVRSTQPV